MGKHHGLSKTRLYRTYQNMKSRCYKEYDSKYKYYGGKGIKICDEWLNDFKAFYDWSMANGYTDELTIDRIDSEKDYCPKNCRWVTMEENLTYSHQPTYQLTPNKEVIMEEKQTMTYEDVRAARKSAGLTQKSMAEYFEIPIRTISDWERGLRNPPEWVCKLLINALKDLGEG